MTPPFGSIYDGRTLVLTQYIGPEVLAGGYASRSSDIYSFGILFQEVYQRKFFKELLTDSITVETFNTCIVQLLSHCCQLRETDRPADALIVRSIANLLTSPAEINIREEVVPYDHLMFCVHLFVSAVIMTYLL